MKQILFLTTILLYFNISYSQEVNADYINKSYKEAIQAFKEKNYNLYLTILVELDSLIPENQIIEYNLSKAYALLNNKKLAIEFLEKYLLENADTSVFQDTIINKLSTERNYYNIKKNTFDALKEINNSIIAFKIKERDLHPESITYDVYSKKFYLSSIHKRKIVIIKNDSTVNNFISEKDNDICAVTGIKFDNKKQLWTCSANIMQMNDFSENSNKQGNGLFCYNIDTKELIKKYLFYDGYDHLIGDLEINDIGIFVSDSKYNNVYKLNKNEDKFTEFCSDKNFSSLQGITISGNGKHFFLADYINGLYKIDTKTGKIISLYKYFNNFSFKGIDGLYIYKNSLIAIQNGIYPMKVIKINFNKSFSKIISVNVLEKNNPYFGDPTLGVIVDNYFYYIANSQWSSYNDKGEIFPLDKLKDIIILKVKIE